MKVAKFLAGLVTLRMKIPQMTLKKSFLRKTFRAGCVGVGLFLSSTCIIAQELQVLETDDNLQPGEMRELQVGPKILDTILIYEYQGNIYATQSKCSHYGYSLAKGLLIGDKILCPLHNAGFNIKTGEPEQGPIFAGLQTFPVERVNGKIRVTVPKEGWGATPPLQELGRQNIDMMKQIVIIGAGAAGLAAAESLRTCGYRGKILMVSKEKEILYDRTVLSKNMTGTVPYQIRSDQSLENNGIDVLRETKVTGIDFLKKQVLIEDRYPLHYDKLLIATGSFANVQRIPGLYGLNYCTLRTIKDYEQINKNIRKPGVKNITILGGGFIGMEIASAIKMELKDAVNITVLEQQQTPLQHVLGKDVGNVLKTLSQRNGVRILTQSRVMEIGNENNNPTWVKIDGPYQQKVPTDLLIVAMGARPAIDFAQELIDPKSNGIKTNVYLQTARKDVYAAGDIASYPYWYTGHTARIEHYNEAIYQGSVAGMNMAGKKFPIDNIPFFWTRQFNNSLLFTGVTHGWDQMHIEGSLADMKFVAYYIRKSTDKVLGAAAMGVPNHIQIINEAMRNGIMPPASEVIKPEFKLQSLLAEINKKGPKCTRCTACHI